MASEDVIELGSSDEDAEPAPKKKKSNPNVMVHIPSILPGVTIKPAKSPKSNHHNFKKELMVKPMIVNNYKNINLNKPRVIPSGNIRISNSPSIRVPVQNMKVKNVSKSVPFVNKKATINPLSIAQNLSKITVKKLPAVTVKNTINLKGPKVLNNLPSSITVTPVNKLNSMRIPIQRAGASGLIKKVRTVDSKKLCKEMLTVEIDDDDSSEPVKGSPQWYVTPEEHSRMYKKPDTDIGIEKDPSIEEKNNKEPNPAMYLEITIEDSPLKLTPHPTPVLSKHPDIGKELTITIEDSPVKSMSNAVKDVESDGEINELSEDKQSKKKLDYPKQSEQNTIEIEIDLGKYNSCVDSEEKGNPAITKQNTGEETKKSPMLDSEVNKIHNYKKEPIADSSLAQNKEVIVEGDEFHPTYQKFIQMCFQLENTDDMKKIVDKKIKAYYRQCLKEYVESEEFIDMVSSKTNSMKASPENMYLYIKDIVDELNLQRKMTKSVVLTKATEKKESLSVKHVEPHYDTKKQRQIRKLEKTIKKLHRAILKLEEQEVDFDDDEDSVYLLTERYKERMVRVHAKFCQLTNTKMPSEPRIHIEARPGRPTAPAKKLEKWINRKVPIGTPLPFPDFHDVIRCVREANEEDKLGWNDVDIIEEARELFIRCGKKLQRRRQENEWRMASSRVSAEEDPAEKSIDLKKKLEENKTTAAKKEAELLNKYVDRQNLLKLEGEEIGDKEAEESPVESEEEDVAENNNSMKDKQKRTQILKRLIDEKSKKDEDKENAVKEDSEDKENNIESKTEESKSIEQETTDKETIESKSNNVEIVSEIEFKSQEAENAEDKQADDDSVNDNNEYVNDDSDTNRVESDIDELHLLQKLHSENEMNTSTSEGSDSDTPIAISDTNDSDSEKDNDAKYDVISIEDSSYSESEMIMDKPSKDGDADCLNQQNVNSFMSPTCEIEYFSTGIKETNRKNLIKETPKQDIQENILLASSDEEIKDKTEGTVELENANMNLREDDILFSEKTVDNEEEFVQENVISNDENSIPDNNNAIEIIEESPDLEESADVQESAESLDTSQDNMEIDEVNFCKNTDQEEHIGKDSPKDIVDIRSVSEVNSVESIESQNSNETRAEICDYTEIHTESNSNERSEVCEDSVDRDIQTSLEKEQYGPSTTTVTDCENCVINMDII